MKEIEHDNHNPKYCTKCIQDAPTEPVIEDWELQQIKSEASIFFSKISEYLPKSLERSALGDEKIYRAFYQAFIEMRPYISHQTRLDLLNEIEKEMAIKEKNKCNHKYSQEDGYCHACFSVKLNETNEDKAFNDGLQVGVDIINKHKK